MGVWGLKGFNMIVLFLWDDDDSEDLVGWTGITISLTIFPGWLEANGCILGTVFFCCR